MNSSPRGRGTDKVRPSPELAHLTMQQLRTYRSELRDEEERVAYWQRLVQSRRDALASGSLKVDRLIRGDLERALGVTGNGTRRTALLTMCAQPPLPELPRLDGPWAHELSGRPVADDLAVTSLSHAQGCLAGYRAAVHTRMAAATSELITRYIANPKAAFDLIPATSASS